MIIPLAALFPFQDCPLWVISGRQIMDACVSALRLRADMLSVGINVC